MVVETEAILLEIIFLNLGMYFTHIRKVLTISVFLIQKESNHNLLSTQVVRLKNKLTFIRHISWNMNKPRHLEATIQNPHRVTRRPELVGRVTGLSS